MVGDALSGTALLLRSAGGGLLCKRPQRHVHVAAAAGAIPREGTPVSSTPQSTATAGSRHEVRWGIASKACPIYIYVAVCAPSPLFAQTLLCPGNAGPLSLVFIVRGTEYFLRTALHNHIPNSAPDTAWM